MLKLVKINKYFNKRRKNEIHIINNVNLEFKDKGLVAILGSSGSGKTTLLNTIGGLDKVNNGKIYINGKKITKHSFMHKIDKIRNKNIGYIFQDYKLIENYTVFDNVALSLKLIGLKNKKEIEKRVNYVLECVKMYRYKNRLAKMLSGGQKQRVAIARALVKNPNILIADEPTGNLDSNNSLEIMNILKSISKNKLVILVTHEVELAKFYASRIIEIQDGKVISDYINEVYDSFEYKLDNKIYLKDLNNIDNFEKENIKINIFSEDDKIKNNINIKIIIKNENIYIESKENKIDIINKNSKIELVDEHYKRIDKSIYENYNFNTNETILNNNKIKYSSIMGIFNAIYQGFKKVLNFSLTKKLLLFGYFASAMFIVFSISNIFGVLSFSDSDFISKNKKYLLAEVGKINVDEFNKIEKMENVEYLLPGDSLVTFNMLFDEYYQTSTYKVNLIASITDINTINNENLIYGKMPENQYEVIIDKMVIDNINSLTNSNGGSSGNNVKDLLGIRSYIDVLDKKLSLDNMKNFIIVGIVDLGSPSLYTFKDNFINIIYNQNVSINEFGGKILDYNLNLNNIKITKGRLPTNDYEVIVNALNKNEIKLNKTINDLKINGNSLIVVGYYESNINSQNYYVNNNTLKYLILDNNKSFSIYTNDKSTVKNNIVNNFNLNIIDSYEKDKDDYINMKKEETINNLVYLIIVLLISLIEIFLMIRASFLSRIKEIGILRAIGVKRFDIYKMFFGEVIAITTVSSVPAIILMSYLIYVMTDLTVVGEIYVINLTIIGLSIFIIYFFNILVGLLPLRKLLRKMPYVILSKSEVE